jgi:hypothetical protein
MALAHAAAVGRLWLDVPITEKERVKTLGARWDPDERSWYAPRPGMHALAPWSRLPEVLAGEDRSLGEGLFIDLIPQTSWYVNVRSAVRILDWYRIRQMVYRRAGYRCEACGCQPDPTARLLMEAHERFTYDESTGVQALRRLICLCSACHTTTHFGAANVRGVAEEAMSHLQRVTGMTRAQAEAHADRAHELWKRRSRIAWTLDLSVISGTGIAVRKSAPPGPASTPPRSATPPPTDDVWPPRLADPPPPGESRITAFY